MSKPFNIDLSARRVEPVKRRYAGSRMPVWVVHRFPINGGLPLGVVWEYHLLAAAQRRPFVLERLRGPSFLERLMSSPACPDAPIVRIDLV